MRSITSRSTFRSLQDHNLLYLHQGVRVRQARHPDRGAGDGLRDEVFLPDLPDGGQLVIDVRQVDVDLHHVVEAGPDRLKTLLDVVKS